MQQLRTLVLFSLVLGAGHAAAQTAFAPTFFYSDGSDVRRQDASGAHVVHVATPGFAIKAVACAPGGAWYVAEEDPSRTRGLLTTRGPRGPVRLASLALAGEELRDIDVADDGGVWFSTERSVYRLLGPGLVHAAYIAPAGLELQGLGVGCDGLWYAALEVQPGSTGRLVFGDARGLLGTLLQTSSPMADVDVVHDIVYAASRLEIWRYEDGVLRRLLSTGAASFQAVAGDGQGAAYYQGRLGTTVFRNDGQGEQASFSASGRLFDLDVRPTPWWDQGGGSVGLPAAPVLSGTGLLGAPAGAFLDLRGARPLAPVLFLASERRWDLPFAAGTLVPAPDVQTLRFTDAGGAARLPLGLAPRPSCQRLYLQAVVRDPGLAAGFVLSNALSGVWD